MVTELRELVERYLAADEEEQAGLAVGELHVWLDAFARTGAVRTHRRTPHIRSLEPHETTDGEATFSLDASRDVDGDDSLFGPFRQTVDYSGPGHAQLTSDGWRLNDITINDRTFQESWQPGSGRSAESNVCVAELVGVKRSTQTFQAYIRFDNVGRHDLQVATRQVLADGHDGTPAPVPTWFTGSAFPRYERMPEAMKPGIVEAGATAIIEISAVVEAFETWRVLPIIYRRRRPIPTIPKRLELRR